MRSVQKNNIDYGALLDDLSIGVVLHNAQTEILYANPSALRLLRLTPEQAMGLDALDPKWNFIDEFNQTLSLTNYPVNQVLNSKKPIQNEVIGITDSHQRIVTWVLVNAYPNFDHNQNIETIRVTMVDITVDKQQIPFSKIVAEIEDIVIVAKAEIDFPGPEIVYVNRAFTELTGYQPSEVLGKSPRILQGELTSKETTQKIRLALQNQQPYRGEILNYNKAGKPYWLDINIVPLRNKFGKVVYYAAIQHDITAQKQHIDELEDQANLDFLTQLNNRRGWVPLAEKMMADAINNQEPLTIATFDIDFFKPINDTYGHAEGDKVLVAIAELMQQYFAKSDVLARLGGEEFAVLLNNTSPETAKSVLDKFRKKLAKQSIPLTNGEQLSITVSIGYTQVLDDISLSEALNQADEALYDAKESGRNCLRIYTI
mgnify:CR=1 FL=1